MKCGGHRAQCKKQDLTPRVYSDPSRLLGVCHGGDFVLPVPKRALGL
jgi:hypothetical protein